jgi:hypothetical protein
MNVLLRTVAVVLAAVAGGIVGALAGDRFGIDRKLGGEAGLAQSLNVLFLFAPLSAAAWVCVALAFIKRAGGWVGPKGNRPLTKLEIGFAICCAAIIAGFVLFIVMT